MFIGVTGTNASGKSETVKYLKERGYQTYFLSDTLRENARIRGIEPTLDNLVALGNNLRTGGGNDILAKRIVKEIIPNDQLNQIDHEYNLTNLTKLKAPINSLKCVIESIRNPAEVEYLKNKLQRELIQRNILQVFYLIGVDAPFEKDQESSSQQLQAVMNMADCKIDNKTDKVGDLYSLVDSALQSAKQYRRDVYYMQIALVASSRSDCRKRMLGAVAVKDDRIISTGFNGAIAGLLNCNEGGCKRCADDLLPSGVDLDKCFCPHAEENAVGQVSCHGGVGLNGATLYTLLYPCIGCAKDILKARIERIVYVDGYAQGDESEKLFDEYQKKNNLQIDHLKL